MELQAFYKVCLIKLDYAKQGNYSVFLVSVFRASKSLKQCRMIENFLLAKFRNKYSPNL